MEKEFVPYELALRMKQLGFDEPCFMYWWKGENDYILADLIDGEARTNDFKAPLYQQAFRWFREKHRSKHIWIMDELLDTGEYTYDEAELACLKYCIEIVEGIES
jgi:hypothetical protein